MGRGKTGCADDSYAEVTWLRKALAQPHRPGHGRRPRPLEDIDTLVAALSEVWARLALQPAA